MSAHPAIAEARAEPALIEGAVARIDELERELVTAEGLLAEYAASLEKQLVGVDAILAQYVAAGKKDSAATLVALIAYRRRRTF